MMFGIDSLYVWLAVIIISVAVEAFTLTLCGIWFAAGVFSAVGSRQPTQIVSSDRLPLLPNRLTMFWRPVR